MGEVANENIILVWHSIVQLEEIMSVLMLQNFGFRTISFKYSHKEQLK